MHWESTLQQAEQLDRLMDSLPLYLLTFVSGLLVLLILRALFGKRQSCDAPQPGGALPIIGHLHLLGGGQLLHKKLGDMADKYGPAFTIKFGKNKVLIISSWEMAKECFTVHDKVFSTRPDLVASKIMGYNYAMFGFAPYGDYWREMRKIVTLELLSNRRIELLKHIRGSEVETSIRELHDSASRGEVVEMKQWFGGVTLNAVVRLVGGKRLFGSSGGDDVDEAYRQSCKQVMRDFIDLFGAFVLSDEIPLLGWFDIGGTKKAMKRTAQGLDNLVSGWLEEHKKKRAVGGDRGEQDFMDVMLNILDDAKITGFDADTINKATCMNLVLAGSDTTMVTLTWALSLLLNNPEAMKKAQDELDSHVSKDRHVEEADLKDLHFLQAVVKETLRLYPPGPLIGLRTSMEECTLSAGYRIPARTGIVFNASKIQRDPRVWPEPNAFRPERFLTTHKDVDVRSQGYEFMPFGGGRRACPGAALAIQTVLITLASVLHCYDVAVTSDKSLDMTESQGLTSMKETPLEVRLTPRLPAKLYEH